jgi:hypothetical protein
MPAGELSNMRKHPSERQSKRKSIDIRVAAVLCMILAINNVGCAAINFVDMYPDYAAQVKEDHGRFCKRHYDNSTMYGSVADQKLSRVSICYWFVSPRLDCSLGRQPA